MKKEIYNLLIIFLLLFNVANKAQITISKELDVKSKIENGDYKVTIAPSSLQGEIIKIFDGEPFTETGTNETDSLVVRIEFDEPLKVVESKAFFMIYNGEWSLESALSVEDLDNRSGSYALHLNNKAYSPFKWDSVESRCRSRKSNATFSNKSKRQHNSHRGMGF